MLTSRAWFLQRFHDEPDTFFPDDGLKSLIAAVLWRTKLDAHALGKGRNLIGTSDVTAQARERRKRDLGDWLWSERCWLWLDYLGLTDEEACKVCNYMEEICHGKA
ncbi:MAG: hypothetical protein HY711_05710 [Candidatus Melainabacteria bacterium]|nr:hypothetical protein [Candidatus Melainabacteria bacterium]